MKTIPSRPYLNQSYTDLKLKCVAEGSLFADKYFPASNLSIWHKQKPSREIFWKRPHEIHPSPQFVVNEFEPANLNQGALGNCFFISAAIAISSVPDHFRKVVPDGQTFEPDDYAGIFHFRFWHSGEWIDVCVDDRLPVDANSMLVYCSNPKDPGEFFGPLLEKAYAKLNTCYEFLNGGSLVNALVDLSGGVNEKIKLRSFLYDEDLVDPNADECFVDTWDRREFLWELLETALRMESLTGTVIKNVSEKNKHLLADNQLVLGKQNIHQIWLKSVLNNWNI
jgi:hypothetical protein